MSCKGQPKSPEHRAKLAEAQRGKVLSAETRAKMSSARKGGTPFAGHRHTPAARARLVAANLGNRHVLDAPVKGECVYCAGPATQYDHAIPRGRPGWEDPANRVPCCLRCNDSKNNRTPDEWLAAGLVAR